MAQIVFVLTFLAVLYFALRPLLHGKRPHVKPPKPRRPRKPPADDPFDDVNY